MIRFPCPDDPALLDVALWLTGEWGRDYGFSVETILADTRATAAGGPERAVALATVNGKPVGVAMLVPDDCEQRRDLRPWLANVFIVPDMRGKGMARPLIAAIEDRARSGGARKLHLFTRSAVAVYDHLGWRISGSVYRPIRQRRYAVMERLL